MAIADKIYDMIPLLPNEEKFGLRSQMKRRATAIPSNTAEGSAKRSQKDYLRYVEISFGSAFELETHSLVVQKRKWVPENLISDLLVLNEREQKMISGFIERL